MKNNSKKNKISDYKKGFSLVEALVAIAILVVSIVGPMTIASKGMTSAVFAKDQITAFYLAQEAVEFIRNERDNNIIKGLGWLTGNLNICRAENGCRIDISENVPNMDKIQGCGASTCSVLRYDVNTNFYNYRDGPDSKFTRIIKMESINPNEEQITVTISWRTGFVEKTFTVKENIFNLF